MKNFTLITICLLFSSCFNEHKKAEESYEVVMRFSETTLKASLSLELAPQTSEHLVSLIKSNLYDGGLITKNESLITIKPIQNSNDLSKVKIPIEKTDNPFSGATFGLVISPILEQGDSTLFICLKDCLDLSERYIVVGSLNDSIKNITNIKSGQKVLTILLKGEDGK